METKINIAEILKDKPQGTILYDYLHNIDVEFDNVETTEIETSIWCTRDKGGYNELFGYSKLGTLRGWLDGLQILLPSKQMRDWSKFAWKKGDVLVSNDSDSHIIFKGFSKNDYTTFEGKHWISVSKKRYVSCLNMQNVQDYHIEDNKDAAQTYIKTIEEHLGGKLNLETLKIEKQPEFKDGDIITFKDRIIIIYNTSIEKSPIRTEIYYHACLKGGELTVNEYLMSCGFGEGWYSSTEEEKHQLFDALAKEGKQWDSEKKMIVDLKPKVEFKPFDKVLCRNSKDDTWEADFFARLTRKEIDYTQSGKYLCVGDLWMYCIPYNEETAHLLGTTDDWEGGEQ